MKPAEVDAAADIRNGKDPCAVIAALWPSTKWARVLMNSAVGSSFRLHLLKHSLNKVGGQEEVRQQSNWLMDKRCCRNSGQGISR